MNNSNLLVLYYQAITAKRGNLETDIATFWFLGVFFGLFFSSLAILAATLSGHLGIVLGLGFLAAYTLWTGIRAAREAAKKLKELLDPANFKVDDPETLGLILEYLNKQVLGPKNVFQQQQKKLVATVELQVQDYQSDEQLLVKQLSQSADEQQETLNQSALLRVRQILSQLNERHLVLKGQLAKADQIVQPLVEQIELIEGYLRRLDRDKRLVESQQLVVTIDDIIPVNEAFLLRLAATAAEANEQLRVLSSESTALAAAKIEVEDLTPDQLQLNA